MTYSYLNLAKRISLESTIKLGTYELVEVLVDQTHKPVPLQEVCGVREYALFTEIGRKLPLKEGQSYLTFMLGDLVRIIADDKRAQVILVNPNEDLTADEVLFAPCFDPLTQKYMMTDPEDGVALLAIRPEDQARYGIEMIFHVLNHKTLAEEREQRESLLQQKIRELSFFVPRVPIKKGSGSFYCVLLNLENSMEETAFIRQYKTFDDYSDVIFVTSELKILTGSLDSITYDGEQIDTIFTPVIGWQQGVVKARSAAVSLEEFH